MLGTLKAGILGVAVGDALGVPVEFQSREQLKNKPVLGMREYGVHYQPAGTWSDDTSMTLCLMDSLAHGLDYKDIMERFSQWLLYGDYTPYGEVFDIGNTTKKAIFRYGRNVDCLKCGGQSEEDNGNGALMRILPISFYIMGKFGYECDTKTVMKLVHNVSSLTHGHIRSKIACGIYTCIAIELIHNNQLNSSVSAGMEKAFSYYNQDKALQLELKNFQRIRLESLKDFTENMIQSTGYVIHSLEAALWCLLNTDNYRDLVLMAVNLGSDTDTTAAIAGGLAGIAYGINEIPKEWLNVLVKKEYIEGLCESFIESL